MSRKIEQNSEKQDARRCRRCQRLSRRCVCAYLCDPPLHHEVKLIVVQSTAERDHVKNTGALLAGSLANAELLVVNLPSHHQAQPSMASLEQQLSSLCAKPYTLLYPTHLKDQAPLTEALRPYDHLCDHAAAPHLAPLISRRQPLVLLDLTWKQSRRLLLSVPHLQIAPRLTLNDEVLEMLRTHHLKCYEELRTTQTQQQTRCSTLEAGLAALIQHDYQSGEVATLYDGVSRYDPIWTRYQRWVQQLRRQFQRER